MNNKNLVVRNMKLFALIIALIATGLLCRGLYFKNVYKNSDSTYIENENAYVGGDAYNYIINGTYFSGFMALSGAMYICATGLFCTALILESNKKSDMNNDEDLPTI